MRKVTPIIIAAAAASVVLLLAVGLFLDALRYPRIARSAYLRHPYLLAKATVGCLFPGKGVRRKEIAAHATELRPKDRLSIRLLYLPDLPAGDKSIKGRTLGTMQKTWAASDEELFWLVTPFRNGCVIGDDRLVYEYRTGRLICAKEDSKLGQCAAAE
ncbi:MAG: hypothetical protein ACYTBJ_25205 [Planctomycetota bacterium]